MRKTFVHLLWSGLFVGVSLLVLFFVCVWNGWVGYMPDMEELQNPINKYASQVYSSDGKLIGTWNENKANRIAVDYNSLSPHIVHALVATEDERFYTHSGIDFIALGRAIVKRGMMGQESAGGGSTITQQLAKQLFSEKAHNTLERLLQKPIEWVIAIKLERSFTKEDIVTMYLNYFDFLHNAVGIKRAANTYFSKEPHQLSITEAATLVGLCKNPSLFNPLKYPDRCLERRNVVLMQMMKSGYITHSEYDTYCAKPLALKYKTFRDVDGSGDYLREFLRQYLMAKKPERSAYPSWNMRQYTIDSIAWGDDPLYGWCNKNLKGNGEPYNIYTDGLKIYTTVDTRMQKYAEEAVRKHLAGYLQPQFNRANLYKKNAPFSSNISRKTIKSILNRSIRQSVRYRKLREDGATPDEIRQSFRTPVKMSVFTWRGDKDTTMTPIDSIVYYKSFLRSAFMSMEAKTGDVKAYVGGIDFDHFKYDMVMLGRRQVGSTIKPYLYSLAMQNGMTPCTTAPNVQRTYGGWTPRNGSHARYGQDVPLKWGLMTSNNWISAYLITRLGPSQFVDILHDFGLNNPDIEKNTSPVLCLGPCEVSVGEMGSAYTTFPNKGVRCAPRFVTKIEDSHGEGIAQFPPMMNEVISEDNSYRMIDMLRAVVDQGTGRRLRGYGIKGQVGGKTGTTNNNSDGWFMGFTPQLVNGCWVGGEDRDIHFDYTGMGQGATMALPIWAYYMRMVYDDKSLGYSDDAKFDIPKDFDYCETDDTFDFSGIEDVYM